MLKRKLQHETLICKCNERQITYLSSKGKTLGMEGREEIAVFCEEVATLHEHPKATPSESVEWMLKCKGR